LRIFYGPVADITVVTRAKSLSQLFSGEDSAGYWQKSMQLGGKNGCWQLVVWNRLSWWGTRWWFYPGGQKPLSAQPRSPDPLASPAYFVVCCGVLSGSLLIFVRDRGRRFS